MPFIAVIWAAVVAFAATTIGGIVLSIGVSLVLGQVAKLFHKAPGDSSLSSELASRTVTSRQAVAPWRIIYGANRVGGTITFLGTTGSINEFLQIVITLSGHELDSIPAMYFDGIQVPLNGSGDATGTYAGLVHAEFNLGTRTQPAFAGLVSATASYGATWTSAHRQRNRAGVYVQLKWDANLFSNGIPNITFDVTGRKVYDPRSGTIGYSTNAALCIADYLHNPSFGLGSQTRFAVVSGNLSQSGVGAFNATQCVDADVTTHGWQTNSATSGALVEADLGSGVTAEFRRARLYMDSANYAGIYSVEYSDNNSTWTAAATGFNPDVQGWNDIELAPNGAHRYWRFRLTNTPGSGSFINEMEFWTSDVDSPTLIAAANTCDEAVTLAAGGTEPRYTANGSFGSDELASSVIPRLNTAMAGSVSYIAGKWGIYPGTWRSSSLTLTDTDLRAPLTVQTRVTHRDLFNGVKGVFISPTNNWQAAPFPPYSDPAYIAEDANELIWSNVEYPFTTSAASCQRISKVNLRRVRRQISLQGQFKLTAYQVQPMDVIAFTHPRFGWSAKTFEVTSCTLIYAPDDQGSSLAVGVDLTLHETDSTVFDWSTADETAVTTPPTTSLPQTQFAQPPTSLVLTSDEIVRSTDGIRQVRILVSWTQPADQFVVSGGQVQVQYKKSADVNWLDAGGVPGNITVQTIIPVVDNTSYDVRIWSVNSAGVASSIVSGTITSASGTSRSPGYSSYRPLSNPLSATDAGSDAEIDVAAFTMRVAGLDISISSGSISGLAYHQPYYVYYDDESLAGGAVTFHAALVKEQAISAQGRFFVGSIVTPIQGKGNTFGKNDGGIGAQDGSLLDYFWNGSYYLSVDPTGATPPPIIGVTPNWDTGFGTIDNPDYLLDNNLDHLATMDINVPVAPGVLNDNVIKIGSLQPNPIFFNGPSNASASRLRVILECTVNTLAGSSPLTNFQISITAYDITDTLQYTGTPFGIKIGGGVVPVSFSDATFPSVSIDSNLDGTYSVAVDLPSDIYLLGIRLHPHVAVDVGDTGHITVALKAFVEVTD